MIPDTEYIVKDDPIVHKVQGQQLIERFRMKVKAYKGLDVVPNTYHDGVHELVNDKNEVLVSIPDSIFVLQENGKYKKIKLKAWETSAHLKSIGDGRLYVYFSNLKKNRLTDCVKDYPKDHILPVIGTLNFNEKKFYINKTYRPNDKYLNYMRSNNKVLFPPTPEQKAKGSIINAPLMVHKEWTYILNNLTKSFDCST